MFDLVIIIIIAYYVYNKIATQKKVLISIEGNISSGKSSLMHILKSNLIVKADYIYEPIDEWHCITDNNGKDILQTFYEDKTRWSYTFQNIAYITRMNHIVDKIMNSLNKYIIIDRSLQADLNTFAKMLYIDKCINNIEWQCYNKWNDFFEKFYGDKVIHKIIYLRCEPTVALDRLKIRNRNAENNVSLSYLQSLHEYHDKWIYDKNAADVLVLDVNEDFISNHKKANEMIEKILEFIY
ncbi:deoxynucleoside kinase [Indivirus ILV1]|uniref:Deoxynucleoside kinase n=1 Tax=Indivirus ILV1 TaxID=1977633 RepID=A0A1V0SE64_9VIRU|nr:deoxynucleoside kinase [Indivirus ILV1]